MYERTFRSSSYTFNILRMCYKVDKKYYLALIIYSFTKIKYIKKNRTRGNKKQYDILLRMTYHRNKKYTNRIQVVEQIFT